MKAMLKIFLMFACSTLLLANAPEKSSYDTQVKILKELDIDATLYEDFSLCKMKARHAKTHRLEHLQMP